MNPTRFLVSPRVRSLTSQSVLAPRARINKAWTAKSSFSPEITRTVSLPLHCCIEKRFYDFRLRSRSAFIITLRMPRLSPLNSQFTLGIAHQGDG
jgi:hypothetical protein